MISAYICSAAEHTLNPFLQFGIGVRVRCQQVPCEGQSICGRFETGQKHRHDLIVKLALIQVFAGLFIACTEQKRQKVSVLLGVGPSRRQDPLDQQVGDGALFGFRSYSRNPGRKPKQIGYTRESEPQDGLHQLPQPGDFAPAQPAPD
jgi:hypothetical protein